jgi:hypothetical protein
MGSNQPDVRLPSILLVTFSLAAVVAVAWKRWQIRVNARDARIADGEGRDE